MPVYPRKLSFKEHVCKPPKLHWYTPWRKNWTENTLFACDCSRRWYLRWCEFDVSEFDVIDFLRWEMIDPSASNWKEPREFDSYARVLRMRAIDRLSD